jgi:LTXXQ motif family protein
MKVNSILASSILAIGLIAGGAQVLAQQQGPGPGGMMGPGGGMMGPGGGMMGPGGGMMGPGGGMMGPRGMMGMMAGCAMMGMTGDGQTQTFAEGRIAFLKAELAITDAQKPVWDTYAEALKRNLQGMQGMRQTMQSMFEAKTPVERLDAHLAAMESRTATLKEIKPALASLYTALSPEQKKKADEVLTGMGCMM